MACLGLAGSVSTPGQVSPVKAAATELALEAGGSASPGSPIGGTRMHRDCPDVSSLADQIGSLDRS